MRKTSVERKYHVKWVIGFGLGCIRVNRVKSKININNEKTCTSKMARKHKLSVCTHTNCGRTAEK